MHNEPEKALKKDCQEAYLDACGPYHNWAIRTIATAAMNALTTKDKFLKAIDCENPEDVQFLSERTGVLTENILQIFKDREIDSMKILFLPWTLAINSKNALWII